MAHWSKGENRDKIALAIANGLKGNRTVCDKTIPIVKKEALCPK